MEISKNCFLMFKIIQHFHKRKDDSHWNCERVDSGWETRSTCNDDIYSNVIIRSVVKLFIAEHGCCSRA